MSQSDFSFIRKKEKSSESKKESPKKKTQMDILEEQLMAVQDKLSNL